MAGLNIKDEDKNSVSENSDSWYLTADDIDQAIDYYADNIFTCENLGDVTGAAVGTASGIAAGAAASPYLSPVGGAAVGAAVGTATNIATSEATEQACDSVVDYFQEDSETDNSNTFIEDNTEIIDNALDSLTVATSDYDSYPNLSESSYSSTDVTDSACCDDGGSD